MATCTDCVHFEVCISYLREAYKRAHLASPDLNSLRSLRCDDCEHFKDRSRFVELPCQVGDTVYFNNAHFRYAKVMAIYIDASGGMFDLKIFTNIETVAGYEHFINKDYTFEDIGKRLFLTKEAAEQALKEREENAN